MITHHRTFLRSATLTVILGGLVAAAFALSLPASQPAAERRGLIFDHDKHAQQGFECLACHDAQKSTTGRDDLLPGHDICNQCHEIEIENECATCHRNPEPRLSPRVKDYSPKFSHERHNVAAKIECTICHTGLDAPIPDDKLGSFPKMAECMECHTTRRVKNECLTCHAATDDLQPADHKLDWLNHHGIAASGESECAQCHKTDDCQKCHSGDPVFNPHPRNYISRHGQDAHLSDISCSVCHDQRDYCVSCHRQMNVLPADHFKPGWVTAGGGAHSEQASFDLESCMACHDTPGLQPTCARCHTK